MKNIKVVGGYEPNEDKPVDKLIRLIEGFDEDAEEEQMIDA